MKERLVYTGGTDAENTEYLALSEQYPKTAEFTTPSEPILKAKVVILGTKSIVFDEGRKTATLYLAQIDDPAWDVHRDECGELWLTMNEIEWLEL